MNGIYNAEIKSTYLGYEDRGIFTFILDLDMGGSGVGFGTYMLDNDNTRRVISDLLKVIGVRSWEEMKYKYVRAAIHKNKVLGIGNLMKDVWSYPGNSPGVVSELYVGSQDEMLDAWGVTLYDLLD